MENLEYVIISGGALLVAGLTLLVMFSQKKSSDKDRHISDQEKRDDKMHEEGRTSAVLGMINTKLEKLFSVAECNAGNIEKLQKDVAVLENSDSKAHQRIDRLEQRVDAKFDGINITNIKGEKAQ